jgi:excisionase family DNA binding protein
MRDHLLDTTADYVAPSGQQARKDSVPSNRQPDFPGAGQDRFLDGPPVGPVNPHYDANRARGPPKTDILTGYLSRDELARELRVSARTVTRWTFQIGGIPHLKVGLRTLYRRESVLAWLVAREQQPTRTKRRAS